MQKSAIALFGEAEKGQHNTFYRCKTLDELFYFFGEPPKESEGLYHAVQAILYDRLLLYFRVHEEGISLDDYELGLDLLQKELQSLPPLGALFLPRIGEKEIVEEGLQLCQTNGSLLLFQASDFYDYMTTGVTPLNS